MSKTKVKSFVKEFVAIVTGDDATAKGEKAFRQAQSALKTQISSLNGDTIQKEDAVTEAEETKVKVRVNYGQPITDRTTYVEKLIEADNNMVKAQKALDNHKKQIAFLEGELTALETETETED